MIKMKIVIVLLQFVFLVCSVSAGPIHYAAKDGDLAGVQAELDKGVDVNAKDDNGDTPLHEAADTGHEEVVELLIANGADVDAKNRYDMTPLHWAASAGHKEIAALLIAKGADVDAKRDDGDTPLHSVAYLGRKEIVELLIAEGADVNSRNRDDESSLDSAASRMLTLYNNHDRRAIMEIITILKENGVVWGGIRAAVCGGDLAYVNQYLDQGGWVDTVDTDDSTLLWYAARAGQFEVVKLLVSRGAHINAQGYFDWTPLDRARIANSNEIYSYLRQNGAKSENEIIPIDPEKIPLQDAAKRLDLVERTLKGLQNLILDGPSGALSIKKLQGFFVISGQAGNRVEVQYHTGDNNWKKREIVTLQANRQLYIDSSSFDEKRFYRIKKID
jgi:cytohesin